MLSEILVLYFSACRKEFGWREELKSTGESLGWQSLLLQQGQLRDENSDRGWGQEATINRKPLTKTHIGKEESEGAGLSHLKVSNLLEKRLDVAEVTLLRLIVCRAGAVHKMVEGDPVGKELWGKTVLRWMVDLYKPVSLMKSVV